MSGLSGLLGGGGGGGGAVRGFLSWRFETLLTGLFARRAKAFIFYS